MSYQTTNRTGDMTTVQKVAAAVGAVFLLVGIAGFIPGITTNFDAIEFAGHQSHAKLLDIFQVSILHNIVHLLFGVAGLALSRTFSGARMFLVVGGVVYLVLFVYGMAIDRTNDANFVPLNEADDYLHLVLGLAMVGLGAVLGKARTS